MFYEKCEKDNSGEESEKHPITPLRRNHIFRQTIYPKCATNKSFFVVTEKHCEQEQEAQQKNKKCVIL